MTYRDKQGKFTINPNSQWYLKYNPLTGEKYKVGYFDIEFSDQKADWGYITCWTIKERGKKNYITHMMKKEELYNGVFDKRIIGEFSKALKQFDLLVGFYSSGCDLPFLRTKCLKYGFEWPKYKTKNHLDLYFALRDKVSLSSRSLKNLTEYFTGGGKIDMKKEDWMLAKLLHPSITKKLVQRNQSDCEILEGLHIYWEDYVKFNRNWI